VQEIKLIMSIAASDAADGLAGSNIVPMNDLRNFVQIKSFCQHFRGNDKSKTSAHDYSFDRATSDEQAITLTIYTLLPYCFTIKRFQSGSITQQAENTDLSNIAVKQQESSINFHLSSVTIPA
jgi:hypothetical protein